MRLKGKLPLSLIVFFALALATLIYWKGYDKPTYGIDDANIYMVYMRHLAQGHGFVWNIGGEKVEGFTSLLWTLIGAVFYKLAGEDFPWLLLALGFALTYVTLVRLLLFVRRCNNTRDKTVTATDVIILCLLFFPLGFIEWNVLGLMETSLWLFLIVGNTLSLAGFYLDGRRPSSFWFGIMLAIMIVTRPESIAYGLLFIAILFVQQAAARSLRQGILSILFPAAAYGITLAGLTAWRLSYFGWPFPNTYYAKVSASLKDNIAHGLGYLHRLFYEYPQVALSVAACFLALGFIIAKCWRGKKLTVLTNTDKLQLVLLAVILSGLALPVATGGDHFRYARFYQCIIPLTYALCFNFPFWRTFLGNITVPSRRNRILLTAVACFAIFFVGKSTFYDFTTTDRITNTRISPEFYHARMGRGIALAEDSTFAPLGHYPSVGILAAGGFAYDYKGQTIDLMGLNSTLMAHANPIKQGFRNHASFDIKTFWKLKPDMVGTFYGGEIVKASDTNMFNLAENTDTFRNGMFVYVAYKGIFDEPEFIAAYLPALVREKQNDFYIFAYYNKEFLDELDKNKYDIILLKRRYVRQR
jgi:arabinofuranosyltransferase